ncbi:GH25 family lysozyme [Actinoplanes sp. NPDC051859]|uniref:GH25 family lysozyme n=1 Tax=Actinoplanes sp. NPDC051859 TaxID=3363909 RepID=UPI0037B7F5B4
MAEPITWLVDISHWQGDIDIAQIAREGYSACVCKATEGTNYKDPTFDRNITAVIKAGMIPGAYHYLRAGDGAAQARHFYQQVRQLGGPDGWLIQFDAESDGYGTEMTAWAAEWSRLTGNHPFFIYSGSWWWPRTRGFRGADLTPLLWHSHYVDGSDYGSVLYRKVPASWWMPGYGGWPKATILQFSSSGKVAGRRIDVDAFRGTVTQLRALTRTPTPAPAQPATPTPPPKPMPQILRELPVLRRGASGAGVRVLQALLRVRGQHLALDGQFGTATETAVQAVQRGAGLAVDGVAGASVYAVLLLGTNPT